MPALMKRPFMNPEAVDAQTSSVDDLIVANDIAERSGIVSEYYVNRSGIRRLLPGAQDRVVLDDVVRRISWLGDQLNSAMPNRGTSWMRLWEIMFPKVSSICTAPIVTKTSPVFDMLLFFILLEWCLLPSSIALDQMCLNLLLATVTS